jgi:hypothetical protein
MGKKNRKNKADQKAKKNTKQTLEVPLPYCTNASDPEHARAYNDDEPCDDARSGESNVIKREEEVTESEKSDEKNR